MDELKNKIAAFLAFSNRKTEDYSWEKMSEKMKKQDTMLAEIEALAKANNTLLGRNVRFPHADSYAEYIIVEVRPRTVVLSWIDYCDAWVDDRVGYSGSVPLQFAKQHVEGRDYFAQLAANRKKV